eukprot:CAMPEP_0116918634 /NCGR_PEP_ID=MMETSP0467-20121206/19883_1 /TAXON_ID=283647 /ORGANISM="Mesodinium pulex, Strain SPMC105" /LENGTH=91 /DNA_ID=CAMNT_0004596011 /DNA_START=150 /DNA_END=425 /DNA_ORIENTATION=-
MKHFFIILVDVFLDLRFYQVLDHSDVENALFYDQLFVCIRPQEVAYLASHELGQYFTYDPQTYSEMHFVDDQLQDVIEDPEVGLEEFHVFA